MAGLLAAAVGLTLAQVRRRQLFQGQCTAESRGPEGMLTRDNAQPCPTSNDNGPPASTGPADQIYQSAQNEVASAFVD
jgi:hypothetical protein